MLVPFAARYQGHYPLVGTKPQVTRIIAFLFADFPVQPERLSAAPLRQAVPGRALRGKQAAAAVLGQHQRLRLQGQDEGHLHPPHVALHAGG